jgi:serine/threonine protein kinase
MSHPRGDRRNPWNHWQQENDPPWLATAFVPGPSLAGVIAAAGPLPEPSVWKLTAGLVEALQAVHAAGLVHRALYAVNARNGHKIWEYATSAVIESGIAVANGIVYFGGGNILYAVRA